jgi:hypothetical protein
MSYQPPLPLTITIPTQHQRLLRKVRASANCVLSLDPVRRTLTTWYWLVFDDQLMLCYAAAHIHS